MDNSSVIDPKIILDKRRNHHVITCPAFLKVSTELNLVEEEVNIYDNQTYSRELKYYILVIQSCFLQLESMISRLDVALSR